MNVTYIFGNGFDINLDLNTKYEDFYNWYIKQPNNNRSILNLKNDINKYIEKTNNGKTLEFVNWSDLELGLGRYTQFIKDEKEFIDVYMDIRDQLNVYIDQIACAGFTDFIDNISEYDEGYNWIQKLRSDIHNPFKYINTNVGVRDSLDINILTLNYSKNAELLFPRLSIYHIHGTTEDDQILGVYNDEQVSNKDLLKNRLCSQYLIKDNLLSLFPSNIKGVGLKIINKTDVLCFFGVSLGETDRLLWNYVKDWFLQGSPKYIIYFVYNREDTQSYRNRLPHLLIKEDEYRSKFCERMQLEDLTQEQLNRILISYNKGFLRESIEKE